VRYLPLHAAHADLLERAGDPAAPHAWRRAAALAGNPVQRAQLLTRAAQVEFADGHVTYGG
jgi:RNA polymerase sigma-70 factor, ECF subfamily